MMNVLRWNCGLLQVQCDRILASYPLFLPGKPVCCILIQNVLQVVKEEGSHQGVNYS